MVRPTFPLYCFGTITITALIIYHAANKYEQFYPTGVYLATTNHALLAITNFAVVLAYLIGKLVIKVFLDKVHERELDLLNDRLKTSITDTILALTIFREHFNAQFVFLLLVLLFFQVFHWLTKYRVEYLEHSPYDVKKNVKLFSLLVILLFFDVIFLYFAINSIFHNGVNSMMLFSLEYGLLLVSAISTIISFFINIEGIKREGRWDRKGLYILYLEFFSEGIKTILYGLFFIVSLIHIGLPIHIIRQLFISFRTFYRRLQDLIQYKSIMNERFQDATEQELENSDKICIVCREDMTSGKKLPCGHILHLHCLRSWLERQFTCPICRALVIVDQPPVGFFGRLFRRVPAQPEVPPQPAQPAEQPQPAPAPVQQPQPAPVQQFRQFNFHQINNLNRMGIDPQRIMRIQNEIHQINQQPIQYPPPQQPVHQQQQNQQQQPAQPQNPLPNFFTTAASAAAPPPHDDNFNPLLKNYEDLYLHIIMMQNHISFMNQQFDHIKQFLIRKGRNDLDLNGLLNNININNNSNINNNINNSTSSSSSSNTNQNNKEDNNINGNSNNIKNQEINNNDNSNSNSSSTLSKNKFNINNSFVGTEESISSSNNNIGNDDAMESNTSDLSPTRGKLNVSSSDSVSSVEGENVNKNSNNMNNNDSENNVNQNNDNDNSSTTIHDEPKTNDDFIEQLRRRAAKHRENKSNEL